MPQNDRSASLRIAPFGALLPLALLLLFGFFDGDGGVGTLMRVAVFQIIAFGISLLLFGPDRSKRREVLPVGKLSSMEAGLLLAALFSLVFLTAGVSFGLFHGEYAHGAAMQYGFSLSAPETFWEGLLLLLTAAVLPAFLEEILFRGVMLHAYRHAGVVGSMLISAFFSALLGCSFESFPVLFLAGLCYGTVRFLTGNLLAPMLLHLFYGIYVLFGQTLLYRLSLSPVSRGLFTWLMLLFFGIALFFVLHFGERILRMRTEEAPIRITKRRRAWILIEVVSAPLFCVTLCLYLVACVLKLFLS